MHNIADLTSINNLSNGKIESRTLLSQIIFILLLILLVIQFLLTSQVSHFL